MGKFSTKKPNTNAIVTENLAGGSAFVQKEQHFLIAMLLTSLFNNQYYRDENDLVEDLQKTISEIKDKKWVAKALLFARNEFGLRSITHAGAAMLAAEVKSTSWFRPFISKLMFRVDDMTETMAYYLKVHGKPIPNGLKRGLADSFANFDHYQLAKYKGAKNKVSLIDLVRLVHPKQIDKHENAIKELVYGNLVSTDTWEAGLSKEGADKGEVWTKLLTEKKLGYFAALRNIRNILIADPNLVDPLISVLTNEKMIEKSLVFPYRYLSAIDRLEKAWKDEYDFRNSVPANVLNKVIKALVTAVDFSIENIPDFEGNTLIAQDISGSMNGINMQRAALTAASLLKKLGRKADLIQFDTEFVWPKVSRSASTLEIANSIAVARGGTDFCQIFDGIKNKSIKYDRIFIISDMQTWGQDGSSARPCWDYHGTKNLNDVLAKYRKEAGKPVSVFAIDLAGYGFVAFPNNKIVQLSGFSDKLFTVMKQLENGASSLIEIINKVEL